MQGGFCQSSIRGTVSGTVYSTRDEELLIVNYILAREAAELN